MREPNTLRQTHQVLLHQGEQGCVHILGHVLGIPAHVEVALLAAQKLCQLSAISPHVHLCHTTALRLTTGLPKVHNRIDWDGEAGEGWPGAAAADTRPWLVLQCLHGVLGQVGFCSHCTAYKLHCQVHGASEARGAADPDHLGVSLCAAGGP